jgi:hypothetical protein
LAFSKIVDLTESFHNKLRYQIIAKSAFVEKPTISDCADSNSIMSTKIFEPTKWWDGTNLLKHEASCSNETPPPLYTGWHWPDHSCPYYRTAYKKYSKEFTASKHVKNPGHGSIYRHLYEELKGSMLLHNENHGLPPSHPFYRMLPSFFQTLVVLQKLQKDYTLVLRTFGSDLDDIAQALRDFASGKHPQFPDFREPKLLLKECHMFRGRYREGDNPKAGSVYDLFDWNDFSTKIASGDDELLNIIEGLDVCGIQDDYEYWDLHNNSPTAGKPVWVNTANTTYEDKSSRHHHLFFDDNIHNDASDSIVAVRSKRSGQWISLSGQETIEMQFKYLVRVPTVAAILQNDWFLQQIAFSQKLLYPAQK